MSPRLSRVPRTPKPRPPWRGGRPGRGWPRGVQDRKSRVRGWNRESPGAQAAGRFRHGLPCRRSPPRPAIAPPPKS
ncbi:MAG: hypothetical protein C4523_17630 [Myxococcales bacterium]|nr:MAG: hypothetical protein C4523_17630 [Myxococcales bacterium]